MRKWRSVCNQMRATEQHEGRPHKSPDEERDSVLWCGAVDALALREVLRAARAQLTSDSAVTLAAVSRALVARLDPALTRRGFASVGPAYVVALDRLQRRPGEAPSTGVDGEGLHGGVRAAGDPAQLCARQALTRRKKWASTIEAVGAHGAAR